VGTVPSANLSAQRACFAWTFLTKPEEETKRREEERGGRPRARVWPFAAHVVRRFSESAARKAAPRPIKLGTTFYNLLSARPVADRLVRVDTRGLGRPPGWPSAQGDQSPNLSTTCGHSGPGRHPGRLGAYKDRFVGHSPLDLNFEALEAL
jgi:hypothetical protein